MYCEQPDQLLDLNWNQGRSPGSHLESAMSSIVPSRSSAAADGVTFHKLMGGRLPSAVDGASEQFRLIDVRLNSPNKLNLSMPKSNECLPLPGIPMPVSLLDQFSGQSYGHHSAQLGLIGSEKLSRVSVPQIGLPEGRKDASAVGRLRLDINNGELINGREESSASDPAASEAVSSGGPSKKRKAPPKDKVMGPGIASSSIDPTNAMEEEDPSAKRRRSMEKKGTETDAVKPKAEENYGCSSNGYNGQKQGKENSSKSAEPLKSYIHVRSRRGQATDSHSLAERVRREKISQRMKLLQDLVPGCNKVTGKAVMLDEIINYVQSLQRQVEFLSMKLATVNPQLDFNLETLLPKAMQQACEPMRNSVYALETSESTAQHINHPRQGTFLHCVLPNDMEIHNSLNILEPKFYGSTHQPFVYGFDTTSSQQGSFWEDDLQNAACMDIGHN